MWVGLIADAEPPSPNTHAYVAIVPSASRDAPALKVQVRLTQPTVKEADGGLFGVTDFDMNALTPPTVTTVSVAWYGAPAR